MNRLFTAFIVGAMVLGVVVGWVLNTTLPAAEAAAWAGNLQIITDINNNSAVKTISNFINILLTYQ